LLYDLKTFCSETAADMNCCNKLSSSFPKVALLEIFALSLKAQAS
jgi:hypothetical protein